MPLFFLFIHLLFSSLPSSFVAFTVTGFQFYQFLFLFWIGQNFFTSSVGTANVKRSSFLWCHLKMFECFCDPIFSGLLKESSSLNKKIILISRYFTATDSTGFYEEHIYRQQENHHRQDWRKSSLSKQFTLRSAVVANFKDSLCDLISESFSQPNTKWSCWRTCSVRMMPMATLGVIHVWANLKNQ